MNLDFDKVVDSNFGFTVNIDLDIYKFATFSVSFSSKNDKIYKYFPSLLEKTSEAENPAVTNIFVDLLKSINFFNLPDRELSDFNMERITLTASHQLGDWEAQVNFTGKYGPNADDTKTEWQPSLSFVVQWIPIPKIKKEVGYTNAEWNVGG